MSNESYLKGPKEEMNSFRKEPFSPKVLCRHAENFRLFENQILLLKREPFIQTAIFVLIEKF